jgi:hypothetical protein
VCLGDYGWDRGVNTLNVLPVEDKVPPGDALGVVHAECLVRQAEVLGGSCPMICDLQQRDCVNVSRGL